MALQRLPAYLQHPQSAASLQQAPQQQRHRACSLRPLSAALLQRATPTQRHPAYRQHRQ
jgi:hypothetical protein